MTAWTDAVAKDSSLPLASRFSVSATAKFSHTRPCTLQIRYLEVVLLICKSRVVTIWVDLIADSKGPYLSDHAIRGDKHAYTISNLWAKAARIFEYVYEGRE